MQGAEGIQPAIAERITIFRRSVAIQRCGSHSMVDHLERICARGQKSDYSLATYARAIAWYEEAAYALSELLPGDLFANTAILDVDTLRARMKAALDGLQPPSPAAPELLFEDKSRH
jgi:hypothetical protein